MFCNRTQVSIRISKIIYHGLIFIIGAVLLIACRSSETAASNDATSTVEPVVESEPELSAEGRLVPQDFVTLSLAKSGQVAEVMVREGDYVQPGTMLLRLGDQEQLQGDLAAAEVELLAANQALENLYKYAPLELANAKMEQAEAEKVLAYAEDKLAGLTKPTPQSEVEQTHANLVLAENQLVKINDAIRRVEKKYKNKNSIWWMFLDQRDFKKLLESLDRDRIYIQKRVEDAVEKYKDKRAPVDEIDLAMAKAELASAQAKVAVAEREVTALQNGPDQVEVAAAEARIKAAEAALEAAEKAFLDAELTAQTAGKVIELNVKDEEWVEAGQPLVVIADISGWIVESEDITEMEVSDIHVGQTVMITPDALPDLELAGVVEAVKGLSEEKRGDVTYTTKIALIETDPRLRWGMTVAVTFEE
jgi:multidrug resistance efflux pump